MKRALIMLIIVLSPGSLASAQELSCESHHDGDAIVSVCTHGDHKTVMRCDADGCSTSSSNDAHISDATYRKLCNDGMSSACQELAGRVGVEESVESSAGADAYRDYKTRNGEADYAEEHKLNKAAVSAYLLREKTKRDAKTTELCQKDVYDKAYCDEFKAKQVAESKEITPSTPVPSTQDKKDDDDKAVRRMKESRECLKDHDAHAWCAIYDKKK
jgi:hypothetical protein